MQWWLLQFVFVRISLRGVFSRPPFITNAHFYFLPSFVLQCYTSAPPEVRGKGRVKQRIQELGV
jgi:hypothetical protein